MHTPALTAALFGLTLALAIGPIALLILALSATVGLGAGCRAALGASLADWLLAGIAFLLGTGLTRALEGHGTALKVIGALVLIGLGAWLAKSAWRSADAAPIPKPVRDRPLLSTFALTVLNPLSLLIYAGFAPQLPLANGVLVSLGLALATGAGSLAGQVALACAGASARGFVGGQGGRWLTFVSGLGTALFGVYGLVTLKGT